MRKYQYKDFVGNRDLTNVVVNSVPVLEELGIDPNYFYSTLIEHPEILKSGNPVRSLNEAGFFSGMGRAFGGMGSAGKARRVQGDIDWIRGQPNQGGLTPDDMKALEREKATHDANAGAGFWGRWGQGWRDADQAKKDQASQQKLAGFQRRFGRGAFANPAAAGGASGGGGGGTVPVAGAGGGGGSTVPAAGGGGGAFNAQSIVDQLQAQNITPAILQSVVNDLNAKGHSVTLPAAPATSASGGGGGGGGSGSTGTGTP